MPPIRSQIVCTALAILLALPAPAAIAQSGFSPDTTSNPYSPDARYPLPAGQIARTTPTIPQPPPGVVTPPRRQPYTAPYDTPAPPPAYASPSTSYDNTQSAPRYTPSPPLNAAPPQTTYNTQPQPYPPTTPYPPTNRYPSQSDTPRAAIDSAPPPTAPDNRLRYPKPSQETYSENEIIDAGHKFFGSVSSSLARAVAKLFRKSGRPNGYILGQDASGAIVAGLRYGQGRLYTKTHNARPIFWQGPTLGYDFGGEGSRVMVLVYNLRSPGDVLRRFGGVEGSAYIVGGVSAQLMQNGRVTIAPIRSGVGLRLGANVGYLKFTQRPTWNPF